LKNIKTLSFSDSVYALASQIPAGKVTTYGSLAKALGNPRASRATGNALRANPNPIVVPCHRVVRSDGALGGYAGRFDDKTKQTLLTNEGVTVVDGKIDLGKFLFTRFSR
jgi:methylated-DNA-[protein]-cysteine S-methyltransferase